MPVPERPSEEVLRFQQADHVISALGDVLASTRPFAELLERIARRVQELTGATGAVIELIEGAELEYVATSGTVAPFTGMRLARSGSLSGLCVQTGLLQYARDTQDDPRVDREACSQIGARSMMVVPLIHAGESLGVVKVVSDVPDAFDRVGSQALRLAVGIVSATIARQRSVELHETLAERFAAYSARMTAAVEASPTAMMIHDPDGVIEVWNPAAEALIGWKADECIGRFPPYLSPLEVEQFGELTQKVLWSGKAQTALRARKHRSGQTIHLRVNAAPVVGPDDTIIAIVRTFEDIIAELNFATAQSAAAERVRRVIERAVDAFVSMDAAGIVTEGNPSAERMFGWTRHEAMGRTLESLIVPDGQRHGHQNALEKYLLTGESNLVGRRIEVVARRKNGTLFPIEVSVTATRIDGSIVFDSFIADISERRAQQESLQMQAMHDELTGLPNRAYFNSYMSSVFDKHRDKVNRVAVVFVDLDGFKAINDTHGHQAGDDVLRTAAQRMIASIRATDRVARLSGDEFVIVLDEMQDARSNIELISTKVLDVLQQPISLNAAEVTVSASLGVAVLGPFDQSAAELIRRADRAMYRAKQQGGRRWHLAAEHAPDLLETNPHPPGP